MPILFSIETNHNRTPVPDMEGVICLPKKVFIGFLICLFFKRRGVVSGSGGSAVLSAESVYWFTYAPF